MFYGAIVPPGKKGCPFVPGGEAQNSILHLSQANILASAKEGERSSLMARFGGADAQPICLATLTAGRQDSVPLDIFLDRYTEFSVLGKAEVHLSGYFAPPDTAPGGGEVDSGDDEEYQGDEEDEDSGPESGDGEEGDEEEDDDGEGLDISMFRQNPEHLEKLLKELKGGDQDSDASDDSEESESDSEEEEEGSRAPHCVIEEIEDQKQEAAAQAGNKRAAAQQAKGETSNKKQKALEQPKPEPKAKQEQQQQQTPGKKEEKGLTAGEVKTNKNVRRWENGFEIEDLAMGAPNGKLAKDGKKCLVNYVGKLKSNGKVFDQTKGKKPFAFRLGVGEVIKGWDVGMKGMRVGDKRRVIIPPHMGYGSTGVKGAIPPNAVLEFEMELVDVK